MGNISDTGLLLFINVTKYCNMNCPRCFITEENRSRMEFLPVETLRKFLDCDYFRASPDVQIAFEGGEPVVAGYDRLCEYSSAISEILPHAKQSMVTNLYSLPAWLPDFINHQLKGVVETTFALRNKFSLQGSEETYLERFKRHALALHQAGIDCPVNVELNKETCAMGPGALVDYMIECGQKNWDFDISVDFPATFANYKTIDRYPSVIPTMTYLRSSKYLQELALHHYDRLIEAGLSVNPIHSLITGNLAYAFNVCRDSDFFTLNPDGSVTTNVLYSDIGDMGIGNVHHDTWERMLNHPDRGARRQYEQDRIPESCRACPHFDSCQGGGSFAPVFDGSGECIGYKGMRDVCDLIAKQRGVNCQAK